MYLLIVLKMKQDSVFLSSLELDKGSREFLDSLEPTGSREFLDSSLEPSTGSREFLDSLELSTGSDADLILMSFQIVLLDMTASFDLDWDSPCQDKKLFLSMSTSQQLYAQTCLPSGDMGLL